MGGEGAAVEAVPAEVDAGPQSWAASNPVVANFAASGISVAT